MDCKKPSIKGTGLKFVLAISSPGFDMERDDFEVRVFNSARSVTTKKDEMLLKDDNTFILTVDTGFFGAGQLFIDTTAYVPDTDFDGGIRKEIDRKELWTVIA